eukprot:TRINITY_DN15075_c0_g1_i1.p1 TRINITY_DN15075_c0_g1~~TRINITY_DN15075_c0_g1_i1.p1  ORF type:complete len:370 (-),score=45.18 TRINITY_DN15075_c0_g1_i1:3-1088(-)
MHKFSPFIVGTGRRCFSLPATMRAVTVTSDPSVKYPPPSALKIENSIVTPQIHRPDDVLIRVHCAGVNRADVAQRKGIYPPPKGASPIIGLEVSGEVVSVGIDNGSTKEGDKVMALLPGGGYSEYCVANRHCCLPVPAGMSMEDAAGVMEAFVTAYQCMVFYAGVGPGSRVLIHAGASGVGLAAIQVCRAAGATQVITTSSNGKTAVCLQHGATHALSRERAGPAWVPLFHADVRSIAPQGVNAILDPVFGGGYIEEDIECLSTDGTIVVIAMMGGPKVKEFHASPFFSKRATLKFSSLRSIGEQARKDLVDKFAAFAVPRLASKQLYPVIQEVLDWTEVQRAHELMDSNKTIGKLILRVT